MSQTKAQLIDNLVQPITGALGSASAPTFSFTSDPNTGLYSPGADQLALTTGGTGRLFINSSGNVGIGITPEATFHAAGSTSGAYIAQIIQNQNAGGYAQQIFRIGTGAGTKEAGISYAPGIFIAIGPSANDTTTPIVLQNNNAQERLRITAAGLVGIGTSTPGDKLEVNGNGLFYGNTGSQNGIFVGSNSSYNWSIQRENVSTGDLYFGNVSGGSRTTRMTLTDSGRLGIGTTSPSSPINTGRLMVQGGDIVVRDDNVGNNWNRGTLVFDIRNSNGDSKSAYIQSNKVADVSSTLQFFTTATHSLNERMRIDDAGRLLVGTTTAINDCHTISRNINNNACVVVNATTSTPVYGLQVRYTGIDPNNAANSYLECYNAVSSTLRAEIRSNGGLANYSANNANLSDINTKKDISIAADTWHCIKQWEIVNYRYKDQADDANLNLGVIAQQIAESCPEVITVFSKATENEPEKLGVKEQQMYWMAIKTLQEAQVRIETLEAEVAALKTQ